MVQQIQDWRNIKLWQATTIAGTPKYSDWKSYDKTTGEAITDSIVHFSHSRQFHGIGSRMYRTAPDLNLI